MAEKTVIKVKDSEIVQERLKFFVKCYLRVWEIYFRTYRELLLVGSQNPGKTADRLGNILDLITRSSHEVGGFDEMLFSDVLEALKKGAEGLGTRHDPEKLNMLSKAFIRFWTNFEISKKNIALGAVEIFFHFEAQFMRISYEECGWENAVLKIAKDAVKSAIRHMRKETDCNIDSGTLCQAIIQTRRSTFGAVKNTVGWKAQEIELEGVSTNTLDMFTRLGLKYNGKYYDLNGQILKGKGIGYRLPFPWEVESDFDGSYLESTAAIEQEYEYLLKKTDLEPLVAQIVDEQPSKKYLGEENKPTLLEEIKKDAEIDANDIIRTMKENYAIVTHLFVALKKHIVEIKTKKEYLQATKDIQGTVDDINDTIGLVSISKETPVWTIGECSDRFVGRTKELAELDEMMNRQPAQSSAILANTFVVYGLGGVGKTQLIRKYAFLCREFPQPIDPVVRSKFFNGIWLDAETEATLTTSFRKVLKKCGIQLKYNKYGEEKNIGDVVQEVYRFFQNRAEAATEQNEEMPLTLIIFDNLDDIKLWAKFLPTDSGSASFRVLITSRYKRWPGLPLSQTYHLDVWTPDDACDFVRACLDCPNDEDTLQLVETMQYIPLALDQAVAQISATAYETNQPFAIMSYLELFEEKKKELVEDVKFRGVMRRIPDCRGYSVENAKTIYTTTLVAIDRLLRENTLAVSLLDVVAFIGSSVSREMFRNFENVKIGEVIAVVGLLINNSMANKSDDDCFEVHPLVQEVLRLRLEMLGEESIRKTFDHTSKILGECGRTCAHHVGVFLSHVEAQYQMKSVSKQTVLKCLDRTKKMNTDHIYQLNVFLLGIKKEMQGEESANSVITLVQDNLHSLSNAFSIGSGIFSNLPRTQHSLTHLKAALDLWNDEIDISSSGLSLKIPGELHKFVMEYCVSNWEELVSKENVGEVDVELSSANYEVDLVALTSFEREILRNHLHYFDTRLKWEFAEAALMPYARRHGMKLKFDQWRSKRGCTRDGAAGPSHI